MRKLIIAFCLIATICALHIQKQNFNIVIKNVNYTNIPPIMERFGNDLKFKRDAFKPSEETLKTIIHDLKTKKEPSSGTEAIMNDYADKIFTNIQKLMVTQGLDPFSLPDQHTGFNYTLIITYHGELDLTRGWLDDISTIHRGGDVVVDYSSNDRYLQVSVPIAFDDMQLTYDYSAKIMGLGPTGEVSGQIKNIAVLAKIGFDTQNYVASLDDFEFTNMGHIDIHFTGNALIDWLINLLTDVVTTLLKPLILMIVEGIIRGGLESAVDGINDAISGFINPTTAAPEVTPVMNYYDKIM